MTAVSREDAWDLLREYTRSDSLIKHALAVEAAMRFYARKFGEDEEYWGVTGLLHDFDYERWPDLSQEGHPVVGARILREQGYPEEMIRAILGHADYTGVPRDTLLAKTLYAVDELAGFIVAVALVRPNKSLHEVEVKSVKKKLKDKAFAKGVNRDDVYKGTEELGIDLDEHIANMIEALREAADRLDLAGTA